MGQVDGNLVQSAWSCYATYSQSTGDDSSTISITAGMRSHGYGMSVAGFWVGVDQGGTTRSSTDTSFYSPTGGSVDKDLLAYSDTWTRTHEDRTISCWAAIDRSDASYRPGKSTAWMTFTVPAKPHWGVSYDANGGTGAPSSQTKWRNESLTLSSTRPTREGHTFKGWSTTKGGSVTHQPGATYTANAALALYAVWEANTWPVTYDANGGTGAPAAQAKTYGQRLTLSTSKPTRALYNFLGWATSASSTVVSYAPGAAYEQNAALALYAVWELAYVRPRVADVAVSRCDKAGKEADDGTYCSVSFSWETDHAVSSVTVTAGGSSYDYKSSGTSGKVSAIVGDGALSIDRAYDVTCEVADDLGSSAVTRQIPPFSFVMDYAPNGSVAIGTVASDAAKRLDVAIPAYFSDPAQARGGLSYPLTGLATGSPGWLRLGTWTGSADSDSLVLELFTGDGYNSLARQNGVVRIMVKNGYQATANVGATKAFGATVELTQATGVKVKVLASAHNSCDVYAYFPWNYSNGWYTAECRGGAWASRCERADPPSTGYVEQEVGYVPTGLSVGSGLKYSLGTLSVDNGAYVSSATPWAYLWGSLSGDRYVRWRVLMGVVYVEAYRVNGIGTSGWKAGTLPASARPGKSMYFALAAWRNDHTAQLWVGGAADATAPGQVWLYSNGTDDVFGSASWPLDL